MSNGTAEWFGVAAVRPMSRDLARWVQYIYGVDSQNLYINLYISNTCDWTFGGQTVSVNLETKYPFGSVVNLEMACRQPVRFALNLRLPAGCSSPAVFINSEPVNNGQMDHGYIRLGRLWQPQDKVQFQFEMPAQMIYANPEVRADVGKAAIVKGPVVYCLEEADNGKLLAAARIPADADFRETFHPELLGGTLVLETDGERLQDSCPETEEGSRPLYRTERPVWMPHKLRFVPYCLWGNRQKGEMLVWIRYRDLGR
jgi:DUF1680 family protein